MFVSYIESWIYPVSALVAVILAIHNISEETNKPSFRLIFATACLCVAPIINTLYAVIASALFIVDKMKR